MCSPALGFMGLQAAGVGMSTASAIGSASAQRDALGYQAGIADINAKLAEASAQQELARGRSEERQLQLQAENMKGSQRAAMAANGIVLGEGTAKNIVESTDYMAEQDMATIRANAARAAFGYRTQGMNYQAQAAGQRAQAAGISPFMQGASTFLTGAGSVGSNWYQMKKAGAFD